MYFNKKVIRFLIIISLIFLLIGGNIFLLSRGIAKAMYEDLEAQSIETNEKNVTFNSYFKVDGEEVHSKKAKISDGETLLINIVVNDSRSIK